MKLSARIASSLTGEPFIVRLVEDGDQCSDNEALLVRGDRSIPRNSGRPIFRIGQPRSPEIGLPSELAFLRTGDVVRVSPAAGEIRVLYRRNSRHNTLFFTERCNSRCLMCSQPPRDLDDGYLVDEILKTIPLMAADTPELCITGGEPTLLGSRLLDVIRATKESLPNTSLHMLSNGRAFSTLGRARQLAAVRHSDFVIGIPLYSDIASKHDFVVQARGAFDETIRGILNLARCKQKVEIRFVIHKQTIERMVETMNFITRNFPFVEQVALMGLEITGFTRSNLWALWMDPFEYGQHLQQAVEELTNASIKALVYNHQLCILPREIWKFARRSISDWKNIYLTECDECAVKSECAGFFASALTCHSRHIHAITRES